MECRKCRKEFEEKDLVKIGNIDGKFCKDCAPLAIAWLAGDISAFQVRAPERRKRTKKKKDRREGW